MEPMHSSQKTRRFYLCAKDDDKKKVAEGVVFGHSGKVVLCFIQGPYSTQIYDGQYAFEEVYKDDYKVEWIDKNSNPQAEQAEDIVEDYEK